MIQRIYALVDPRDGLVRYVGKTIQALPWRLQQHRQLARTEHSAKADWLLDLESQGLRPDIRLLEELPDKANWRDAERRWGRLFAETLINDRSPGSGGCDEHQRKVCWTPAIDARLGTVADAVLAEELGCSRKNVTYRRDKLGVPAAHDRTRNTPPPAMGGWNRQEFSPEVIARLGTIPDYQLAAEVGSNKKTIARLRREGGIPSFGETHGYSTRFQRGHANPRSSGR